MTSRPSQPEEAVTGVDRLHPRSLRFQSHRLSGLIRSRLWLQVLVGMVLGIGTGVLLGPSVGWLDAEIASVIASWLALPGQLFLAVLQMIVVPLVVASVARGIASSENSEQLRTVGIRVVVYFVLTTLDSSTCVARPSTSRVIWSRAW